MYLLIYIDKYSDVNEKLWEEQDLYVKILFYLKMKCDVEGMGTKISQTH